MVVHLLVFGHCGCQTLLKKKGKKKKKKESPWCQCKILKAKLQNCSKKGNISFAI